MVDEALGSRPVGGQQDFGTPIAGLLGEPILHRRRLQPALVSTELLRYDVVPTVGSGHSCSVIIQPPSSHPTLAERVRDPHSHLETALRLRRVPTALRLRPQIQAFSCPPKRHNSSADHREPSVGTRRFNSSNQF